MAQRLNTVEMEVDGAQLPEHLQEDLEVGGKALTITKIVSKLSKDEAANTTLTNRWKELARDLEVKNVTIKKLEKSILLEKSNEMDAVEEILIDWKSRNSKKATLSVLTKVLTDLKMEDVATVLDGFRNTLL